jgi:hypothetical protein
LYREMIESGVIKLGDQQVNTMLLYLWDTFNNTTHNSSIYQSCC